jgi:sugar-specific transcriptional regulator TrmB
VHFHGKKLYSNIANVHFQFWEKKLKVEDDEIEILAHLGLTQCQAKIYLTLVSSGTSTANTISINSKVSREHVYQILPKLEKIGFVERIIATPAQFKAIPLEFAVSILFKQRKLDTFQLQKKTSALLNKYIPKHKETKFQEEKSIFVMIPKKEASIRKNLEEFDGAKTSIDLITSWRRFPLMVHNFGENTKGALKQNVKVRVILEKPPNGVAIPELISELNKFRNYELRYILNPPSAIIGIFDKKRIMIKTSALVGLAEAPSLWSNNLCLLSVFNDFFELTWKAAMETIPEDIEHKRTHTL